MTSRARTRPCAGVLDPTGSATFAEGLREALRQAGYRESANLFIEWRRPSETEGELRSVVSNLVRSKVVAMLISVAALTIGRDLHATTDRAAFDADLDRAFAQYGP